MECMESPSLLPLFSNDELQNLCELLSCDSNSPLAHESNFSDLFPHNASPSNLQSFNDLPSPPYSPQPFLCSPPFSPNCHPLPNPIIVGFAKRDWLSSLSQLSPSSTPSPSGHIPSSLSSSLATSYSLIASSHSLCARTSSSTKLLQTCKTLPLPSKLIHDELHLNPELAHMKNRLNKKASGKQCSDGDDSAPPKVQGSMLGANASGVALRLSDVKAALQAMPLQSHLSNSANASLSSATFTLNSSNSTNPHNSIASEVNLTIHPASITSCDLTSVESPTNVDKWLHTSRTTKGQLTRPNAESKWCESKTNKITRELESASRKVTNQALMLNVVMKDTSNVHEFEELARRRKIHIYNDRERRQGMKYRYGILHSLLPDKKIKSGRCAVLTGTIEYIQSLLKILNELDQKKMGLIRSTKMSKEINNTKPNAKINATKSFVEPPLAKNAKKRSHSRSFNARYNNRHMDHTHNLAKESINEDFKIHAKAKGHANVDVRKNKVGVRVHKEIEKLYNSSAKNIKVKDGADAKNIDNTNSDRCGGGKIDDVVRYITMNGDESAMESHETREKICVSFFGEDAFINMCTSKRRGAWSSLLEFLEQLGIYIRDVTLSSCPDFNHHRIHAKVSTSCKLNSSDLQERLIEFVCYAQITCPMEERLH